MARPIRIIDKRNKQYFVVDDAYLNGYAKVLGPITSMVYITLCRHVDKFQSAFPSQKKIAEKIGCGVRSVKDSIAKLKEYNLIDVERERTEHKWARNNYFLLDKSVWKKISGAGDAPNRSGAPDCIDQGHQVHTKDTHIKDTHTLSIAKLKELDEDELIKIADMYNVPLAFVKSKYDDLINYCERTGKKYKNYTAALRNFVKTDAIKIKQQALDKGDIYV